MRSKIFSFKSSLVKNNLRHSWPLWVCATLPLVLMQITAIVSTRAGYLRGGVFDLEDVGMEVRSLWADMTFIAPYFNLVYGCMVAVVLLQSLYTSRSVIGIHALPITREQNWLGWVVSGFALEAIPLGITLVVGTAGWLGLPGLTFGSLPLILTYVIWMLCSFAWGFGFALFCGMFTGQLWALPVFTFILNFLGFGLQAIFELFQGVVLYGYHSGSLLDTGIFLSPFLLVTSKQERLWRGGIIRVEGIGWMLLLGALGLVFMGLALIAYRLRPLERAGELVVFRPFRTVFRIGFAVCFALCGGVFGGTLTNRVGWETLAYILVFGALGMALAQIALKKNFHVLSRRLVLEYAAAFGVVSAVFACGLCGGFGFNHWLPDPAEVESVFFQNAGDMHVGYDQMVSVRVSVEDEEQIRQIVQWHEAYLNKYPDQKAADASRDIAVDSFGEAEQAIEWGVTHTSANIILSYHMKNGKNQTRAYYFTVDRQAAETEGTMEWQLEQLIETLTTPEAYIKANTDLWEIEAYINEDNVYYGRGKANTAAVVDALVRDMALRNEKMSLFYDGELTEPSVTMGMYGNGYLWLNLTEARYPNTLRVLNAALQEGAEEESTAGFTMEK